MKLVRLFFATLLVSISAVLGLSATSSPAYADSAWFYSRYDMEVNLRSDGWADVTTYLDFDFTAQRGRGPVLTFITQMDEPGTDRYRVIEYSNFRVTSPTGANTQVHYEQGSNTVTYQIGDENRFYNNVQSYVITYSVRGLVEPNHSSGFDEFNWNAIGESFDLRIVNPTVTLHGPADVTLAGKCFYGSTFSTPCEATTDGAVVTYHAPTLAAGQGMQVGAGFPVGTFVGAEPVYGEHVTIGKVLAPTPMKIAVGAAAVVLGVATLIGAKRRFGRDEIFAGLTPGNIPAGGDGPVMRGKHDTVAVAFTPPPGVRPSEGAVLMSGGSIRGAKGVELSATVVDLAVRGYITIAEEESKGFLGLGKSQDWTITPTGKPDTDLLFYEQAVLAVLQRGSGSPVRLKTLASKTSSAKALLLAQQDIVTQAVKRRAWFRNDPAILHTIWIGAAIIGIIVGVALFAFPFAGAVEVNGSSVAISDGVRTTLSNFAYAGVAMLAISIVALATSASLTNRTAMGSAIEAQLRGFKEYISTAEADQLRWEEGEDIYSAYLPWAIVFGEVEHWSKVFTQLQAMGLYVPNPYWYYSPYGHDFTHSMGNLTEGLVGMTAQMQSMISKASSYASSGSSSGMGGGSFSGGGGGFGGGGGGGW